ncbi:MAG: type II secretion system GspH family protein [Clostridiales bacterium]|nr:type II secretion system GspH family protein [Clostridiales bacterium]
MRIRFCNSKRYALQNNSKTDVRGASKGFSLLETVIAMTIITIVFTMAVSSMLFVSTTLKKVDNQRFFTNEAANFLECYKVEGSEGFAKNANEFFFGAESNDGSGGAGSGATGNNGTDGYGSEGANSIVAPETGSYTVLIGYDSDYNRQIIATYGAGENIPEAAFRQKYFTLVITIDKSFECVVYNFKGSVLFEGGKFYSRYDL